MGVTRVDAAPVDRVLRDAVDRGDVPAVVAMAATAAGEVYRGAFGPRVASAPDPVAADDVFVLASLTKALASIAALQQVDRGALSLDGPIGDVLPEIGAVEVLLPDGTRRAPRRPVTLRDLLTHTSGLGYDIWNPEISRLFDGDMAAPRGTRARIMTPLLTDPGTRWNYSVGIDWAGIAVERTSGQDLQAYLQANVFAPIGMTDTGYILTPERASRLVETRRRQADGGLESGPYPMQQPPATYNGGGGLLGTPIDYLAFSRAMLTGTPALLSERLFAETRRNQIGALRVLPMRSVMPALSADAELFPGVAKSWTLAFQRLEDPAPTGRAAGSISWAGLGNTYHWIDPARGVCGVFFTQVLPFADPPTMAAFAAFETALYSALRED